MGKPEVQNSLPVNPDGWTGKPKEHLETLLKSGMKKAAAVVKVQSEHEGEHGGDR